MSYQHLIYICSVKLKITIEQTSLSPTIMTQTRGQLICRLPPLCPGFPPITDVHLKTHLPLISRSHGSSSMRLGIQTWSRSPAEVTRSIWNGEGDSDCGLVVGASVLISAVDLLQQKTKRMQHRAGRVRTLPSSCLVSVVLLVV